MFIFSEAKFDKCSVSTRVLRIYRLYHILVIFHKFKNNLKLFSIGYTKDVQCQHVHFGAEKSFLMFNKMHYIHRLFYAARSICDFPI